MSTSYHSNVDLHLKPENQSLPLTNFLNQELFSNVPKTIVEVLEGSDICSSVSDHDLSNPSLSDMNSSVATTITKSSEPLIEEGLDELDVVSTCNQSYSFPGLIHSSSQTTESLPTSSVTTHLSPIFNSPSIVHEGGQITHHLQDSLDEDVEASDSSSSSAPNQELSTEISAIDDCDGADFEELDA